ncbi:hypothetical protein AC249_AIPGENE4199 [Exaiptasia diaphana]|nr:hypothetical protein AC249_AIPGENE4199 [Exaiptasia diaphana]
MESTDKWYLNSTTDGVVKLCSGGKLQKIRLSRNGSETLPGAIKEVKNPDSLTKMEIKKYYRGKKPQKSDVVILFQQSETVIVLDHQHYDHSAKHKLNGQTVDQLVTSFKERVCTGRTEKRTTEYDPSSKPPKKMRWDQKTVLYNENMVANISSKRIKHDDKDLFKVPITQIKEMEQYQTRQKDKAFIEKLKSSMLNCDEMVTTNTVVYLVTDGDTLPIDTSGKVKTDAQLYVLGGTHYL